MPTPRKYQSAAERQAAYRQRRESARRAEQEAKGLPPLPAIATMPGEKRWRDMSEQARTLLQTMRDEMQDYYEDRSETWQDSEKGEALQERIERLDELIDQLDSSAQP